MFFRRVQQAQFAALLDAIIEVAPKSMEILQRGDQRADHHQPEKNKPDQLQPVRSFAGDEHGDGANLQNHFCFAESGRGNRETLGGSDIAQAENGELAPDDDYHHPGFDEVHVHQGNECGGDEQFVGDRIEQDAEGGYLQATPREIAVRPVGEGGKKKNQNPPKFKMHGESPNFQVRTARQQNDDQHWDEEYPQQCQRVREVHGAYGALRYTDGERWHRGLTIDSVRRCVNAFHVSKTAKKRYSAVTRVLESEERKVDTF